MSNTDFFDFQTSELGITEHLAEDPCKFAVWIGEPPFTEEKRIIKVSAVAIAVLCYKKTNTADNLSLA